MLLFHFSAIGFRFRLILLDHSAPPDLAGDIPGLSGKSSLRRTAPPPTRGKT
jgi:hypothetical protein